MSDKMKAPFRTGVDDHWSREVRDSTGWGFAFCGALDGREHATLIARALNEYAERHPDEFDWGGRPLKAEG